MIVNLGHVAEDMRALVEPYSERVAKPETRPPGARVVSVLHVAVPLDGGPADA